MLVFSLLSALLALVLGVWFVSQADEGCSKDVGK